MKLSEALTKINGSQAEKTAALNVPAMPSTSTGMTPSNDLGDRLKHALAEAVAPAAQKQASAHSPVEDLTKIAADLSRSEHESLVKEAQHYGAAVADGFMARLAQYNAAADQQPTKTASADSLEKFASENPQLMKDAAQVGYDTTQNQLEKLASASYNAGWNTTVQEIHKLATESFVAGFKAINDIIGAAR